MDVYHTSTRGVALVRIWNAGLKHVARGSLKIQDAKMRQKNRDLGTIPQLCRAISSQLRHISTIGKKLLSSNIASICTHNMVNFGLLTAEIGSGVWGTPANFNGFRVLAALLHGTLVVGVSQTLRRWTDGATYIRQGDHSVGHWPTFFVLALVSSVLRQDIGWEECLQNDLFCVQRDVIPRLHDTTGCQTGCQTGLTTGWVFVYTIQPIVKPVWQPVDNRLYRVNGA